MTDLRIDYGLLGDARAALDAITREFSRATERRDASAGVWGADEVRDVMHAFVDDWGRHRRLLCEDLEAFGAKVDGMMTAFRDTDQELAGALERPAPAPAGAPSAGGGR